MKYKFHCDLTEEEVDRVLEESIYLVIHSMGHVEGKGFWILLEAR